MIGEPSQKSTLELMIQELVEKKTYRKTSDATYYYHGFAKAGSAEGSAVWQIMREKIDGTEVKYPNGDINYSYIWTNATSLTYS